MPMTETEWLACDDPATMLRASQGHVSERKLRLFACACCRRVGAALTEAEDWRAIEVAERYADGLASESERAAAHAAAGEGPAASFMAGDCVAGYADVLRVEAMRPDHANDGGRFAAQSVVFFLAEAATAAALDPQATQRWACAMLRDVSGTPFRAHIFDPAWHTATVTSLAEAIYADRAFDRLPILADALEDAGCTNRDILDHCRQPGEHTRGCWVVDLALTKS